MEQQTITLNRQVITLIRIINKAMSKMLANPEDVSALSIYNGKFEELDNLISKMLYMNVNPHTQSIDMLSVDERNIFERSMKNANKMLLTVNYN